jgi:transaldolase
MPPATIAAFRDHGEVQQTVTARVGAAEGLLKELERAGISMRDVTDQLLTEGIASFQKSFDELLAGISKKSQELVPGRK